MEKEKTELDIKIEKIIDLKQKFAQKVTPELRTEIPKAKEELIKLIEAL